MQLDVSRSISLLGLWRYLFAERQVERVNRNFRDNYPGGCRASTHRYYPEALRGSRRCSYPSFQLLAIQTRWGGDRLFISFSRQSSSADVCLTHFPAALQIFAGIPGGTRQKGGSAHGYSIVARR